MIIGYGLKNKFQIIDDYFYSEFTFKDMNLKVNNLLNTFSKEEVYDYFITMLNLENNNKTKYLYALFFLPFDFIEKNIEQILPKMSFDFLENIYFFINNDNYKYIFTHHIKHKLTNSNISKEELTELKNVSHYINKEYDGNYYKKNPNKADLFYIYKDIIYNLQEELCIFINNRIKRATFSNNKEIQEEFRTALLLMQNLEPQYITLVEENLMKIILTESEKTQNLKTTCLFYLKDDFYQNISTESYLQLREYFNKCDSSEKVNIDWFAKVYRLILTKTSHITNKVSINIKNYVALVCHSHLIFNNLLLALKENNEDINLTKQEYIKKTIQSEFIIDWENNRTKYIHFCLEEIINNPHFYNDEIKFVISKIKNESEIWRTKSYLKLNKEKINKDNYHKDNMQSKTICFIYIVGMLSRIYDYNKEISELINEIISSSFHFILLETIGINLKNDIDISILESEDEMLFRLKHFINQEGLENIEEVKAYSTFLSIEKHEDIINRLFEKDDRDLNNILYHVIARGTK